MKVIKCSDDTYALIADHAAQRRLSLSQAVGELVSERVVSPEYVEDMALPVETVREVVRQELQRNIGEAEVAAAAHERVHRLKDQQIAEKKQQIAEMDRQIEEMRGRQLFHSLAEAVAHAKSGTCQTCKTALEDFGESVARKTLTEISDKAVLALVIDRGLMPETIRIQLPD